MRRESKWKKMAGRITASVVDFHALAAKIPAQQMSAFGALQGKVQSHLRKVNSLPASAPAIDFDSYRSKITVPGMVDDFAAKYAALQIPYPSDQGALAAIDTQAKEQQAAVATYCKESDARITNLKAELAKWEAMKPIEEMNYEEALDAGLLGTTIKGVANPDAVTLWPHEETWEEYRERLNATPNEDAH